MDGNGGTVRVAPGRAWIIGGALFLASVVLGVGLQPLVGVVAGGTTVATLLFSAALVVFALGVRGAGSVTARRPSGTIALCALAGWSAVLAIVEPLAVDSLAPFGNLLLFGYVDAVVQFVLALIAIVQIGRAGVVPRPWTWAPAWVLAAVVVLWLVQQLVGALAISGGSVPAFATVVMTVDGLVRIGAPVLFGVVAIVYAGRVPAVAPAARTAHPTRSRRVSS